jgi:hypothetical protein
VVSLWPFLGWRVTENVCALTASPAGGHFLDRQKVTKERLKGFALKNPTRGFPLDLPADGANAPYPLIPAGLFVFPAGGRTPPAFGLRGRRRAAGGVGGMACWFVAMFRCGADGRARVLWHNPYRKSFLQRAAKQSLRPTAEGGS